MNDCIFDSCNLSSESNCDDLTNEELKKMVQTLLNTTTAKMLLFEGKLSELCKYIKNNLSNQLRELINDMEHSGELTELISKQVFEGYTLVQQRVQHYITPQMYGAMGNGITDDTEGIQKAINALDENVRVLHIPAGTYLVSEDIKLKSGIVIRGDGVNSVIRRVGTDATRYNVLYGEGNGNITIENLCIRGDRNEHDGTSGEWGMCIGLYGCADVWINNCTLTDGWGDGVYVGSVEEDGCYNITIDGCVIDNNRRNNVSVIECDGFRMVNTKLLNANGTAPKAGIDFEPNNGNQKIKNAVVENCYFAGNLIDVAFYDRNGQDVTIQNCQFNSKYGVMYDSVILAAPAEGAVNIQNCVFNNAQNCHLSNRKHINSVPVIYTNCVLSSDIVAVQVGSTSISYEEKMGNLHFVNCYVAKSPHSTGWFRYQNSVTTSTIENVTLDVRLAEGVCQKIYCLNSKCQFIGDIKCVNPAPVSGTVEINKQNTQPLYLVNNQNGACTINLNFSVPYGLPITIRNLYRDYDTTITHLSDKFVQYDNAKSITLPDRFDEVTIIHDAEGVWRVIDKTAKGVTV